MFWQKRIKLLGKKFGTKVQFDFRLEGSSKENCGREELSTLDTTRSVKWFTLLHKHNQEVRLNDHEACPETKCSPHRIK